MTNILKTTLIATAVLMAPMAYAAPFDGAYTGVQLGVDNHKLLGYGVAYGVFAGYNATVSEKVVLGVEANLDFSTAKLNLSGTAAGTPFSLREKIGRSYGVAARAGFLAGPNTLLYVKGGYENIRVKLTTTGNVTSVGTGPSIAGNLDTYVLGGGVEQAISDQATIRLGYDYANGKAGYDRHRVMAGVAFHF